jgi:NADH pyrophosphatase NudC (nudix superfamily)
MPFTYCPQCASPLAQQDHEGIARQTCPDAACGFVHWDNPVPVVAAVVEHEGHIILARNAAWPVPFYALITGFLEKHDPHPQEAIMREVKEELNLDAQAAHFIGLYSFPRKNQIIMAYHVPATGEIVLNEALVDYKRSPPEKARYWPSSTGLALRDWLIRQGHYPQELDLPKLS